MIVYVVKRFVIISLLFNFNVIYFIKKGALFMAALGNHLKGEIEIKRINEVYTNQYADVYNDFVIFPSGYEGTYLRVNCKPSKSIAVLPITKGGKIVVIKTYRHGVRGWGLEIPKGAIEENESNIDAVARELEEETGFIFNDLMCVGEYSESPAILANKIDCFIAKGCELHKKPTPEKTETISIVLELSIEEFLSKKNEYDYIDAVSELLIYKYIIYKEGLSNG